MNNNVLRVDSSARIRDSISRQLLDETIAAITPHKLTVRDLANSLPHITATWVSANFTAANERTSAQIDSLSLSDTLIEELRANDTLIIGVPIYNFSIPASLKSWIDLVTRAQETFRYTESGSPEGLLTDKRAILIVASGGVEIGSQVDFATAYMHHILSFIGITDVQVIGADRMMSRGDEGWKNARQHIQQVAKNINPTSYANAEPKQIQTLQ